MSTSSNADLQPGSEEDLSAEAFQAYTDGNFKVCKELLDTLKKQNDPEMGSQPNKEGQPIQSQQ